MSALRNIAIIGGGFAGTMVAVQLARRATTPLTITLYDAMGGFAHGVAYGTDDPAHLLNVQADRMGAFEDKLNDFYRWTLAHEQDWRARYPDLVVERTSFLPRMLYGDYVQSLLEDAERSGKVRIDKIKAEVIDAVAEDGHIMLTLADGNIKTVDRLVLALGNLPAHVMGGAETLGPHYTGHIWAPPEGSILAKSTFTKADAPVLIIGTGLTTIDALVTLRRKGFKGKILAVSRHGLLPQPHITGLPAYPHFLKPESAPRTAYGLIRAIRREVKRAKKYGIDWRGVVDSLRADTPALWMNLPEKERRKLTRVLSFWGVHRHRMPPSSAELIEREKAAGTLEILCSHVHSIRKIAQGLEVGLFGGKTLNVAHVLNCSGPNQQIARANHTLLKNLTKRGTLLPGPLDMGIAVDEQHHIRGGAQGIFALGPLLVGERLETIAVPELRSQAAYVAEALLNSFI